MKKFIFFLILHFVFPPILFSGPVTFDLAEKAVKSKIGYLGKSGEYEIARYDPFWDAGGKVLFYLFELSPTGYMAVSGDDNISPIIAYSFSNRCFLSGEGENILVKLLTADITNRLTNLKFFTEKYIQKIRLEWDRLGSNSMKAGIDTSFQQWPPEGSTSTGGWLETNYTQTSPYNNFCPMDLVTNQRSIAGCPAVAMAQIVNYYQTMNGTVLDDGDDYYHNYAGRKYWIDDDHVQYDFPSFPALNSYLDTLTSQWNNHLVPGEEEKAAITFACGVAAKQVYTSSAAGTFGVDQAFDAYLRFGFFSAQLLYDSDTSLFTVLSQNMKDSMPAHLAVVDPQWNSGHNLVVDGYNTDDYYHLNFGWGGAYNGWYLLPEEIPYNLTVLEGVIVNIGDFPASVPETLHFSNGLNSKVFPSFFSDKIQILIKATKDEALVLSITDLSGNPVVMPSANHVIKGRTEFWWDGKNKDGIPVSTGMYLIRLETPSGISVHKCIKK